MSAPTYCAVRRTHCTCTERCDAERLPVVPRLTRDDLKARSPYPIFCRTPERCAGKSYCQNDICCAD